jgi:hypothetical protein
MNKNLIDYLDHSADVALLLSEDQIEKKAQESGAISSVMSSLIDTVKNYASAHIDPNNKLKSVLDLLVPGMLISLGGSFRILGGLLWLSGEVFGFNFSNILEEISSSIKNMLMNGGTILPQQVDQITHAAVQSNYGEQPTEATLKKLSSKEIQAYKIALLHNIQQQQQKISLGVDLSQLLFRLMGAKTVTASILSRVLSWIVKTILISAGLMLVGDIGEKMLGHSTSPASSSNKDMQTTMIGEQSIPSPPIFQVNQDYHDQKMNVSGGWIENTPPSEIGQALTSWAEDIYPDLKGKEAFIQASPVFQATVRYLQDYNQNNTTNVTFMPKKLTSRKQVVDLFASDLSNKVKSAPPSSNNKQDAVPII